MMKMNEVILKIYEFTKLSAEQYKSLSIISATVALAMAVTGAFLKGLFYKKNKDKRKRKLHIPPKVKKEYRVVEEILVFHSDISVFDKR